MVDPTPYPDINLGLTDLRSRLRAILQSHLVGMYLYGSLALGDFDPRTSDIDLMVVTDGHVPDQTVAELQQMHHRFAEHTEWGSKIEAAYVPRTTLHAHVSPTDRFPQIEKDRPFGLYPVESGWVIQLYTLRERGVTVAGPPPSSLMPPIAPDEVRRASAAHAVIWANQARADPDWLDWARQPDAFAFLVPTLCRMLYSLRTGDVISKPGAIRWMLETGEGRWTPLMPASMADRDTSLAVSERDLRDMLSLVDHVAGEYQTWISRRPNSSPQQES